MKEHGVGDDDVNVQKILLTAAVRQRDVPPEKIHELVCGIVDKMKAAGAPPEKVLIAVKEAVFGDKAVRATFTPDRVTSHERILDRAVYWCIQRYYGSLPTSGDN